MEPVHTQNSSLFQRLHDSIFGGMYTISLELEKSFLDMAFEAFLLKNSSNTLMDALLKKGH